MSTYDSEMKKCVDKYILENPEKYKEAQKYGEFIMNSRFCNTNKFEIEKEDLEGNEILFREIVNKKLYYNLSINDLLPYEIEIIKKKFGTDWQLKFNAINQEYNQEHDEK